MTGVDREIWRALGGKAPESAAIDDLQGLLLQISLAIMMIFMMSFFMFRMKSDRDAKDNLLELNRQKLILAAENVEKSYRERYGLDVLTRIDEQGQRVFDAGAVVSGGKLTDVLHLRGAFVVGSASAARDYADRNANLETWRRQVLVASGVSDGDLSDDDRQWLDRRCLETSEALRRDLRMIQRACAANVQRAWLENPSAIGDRSIAAMLERLAQSQDAARPGLAAEISAALKERSVARLGEMCGAEMLP